MIASRDNRAASTAQLQGECEGWEAKHLELSQELANVHAMHAREIESSMSARREAEALLVQRLNEHARDASAADARVEAVEMEKDALTEQAVSATQQVTAVTRELAEVVAALEAARNEGTEQAGVMGRQQQQLESLMAGASRERDAAKVAAADAAALRGELNESRNHQALTAREGSDELARLRMELQTSMRDAEASERRLMEQLAERSAALSASMEELSVAKDKARMLDVANEEQRTSVASLEHRLQQAVSDGALALATVERLESELRQAKGEMVAQAEAVALGAKAMRSAGEYEKSVTLSVDRSLRSARESEAAAAASSNAVADVRARHAAELSLVRAEASEEREVLTARLRQAEHAATTIESRAQSEISMLRQRLKSDGYTGDEPPAASPALFPASTSRGGAALTPALGGTAGGDGALVVARELRSVEPSTVLLEQQLRAAEESAALAEARAHDAQAAAGRAANGESAALNALERLGQVAEPHLRQRAALEQRLALLPSAVGEALSAARRRDLDVSKETALRQTLASLPEMLAPVGAGSSETSSIAAAAAAVAAGGAAPDAVIAVTGTETGGARVRRSIMSGGGAAPTRESRSADVAAIDEQMQRLLLERATLVPPGVAAVSRDGYQASALAEVDRQLAALLAARAAVEPLAPTMGAVLAAAVPAVVQSERPSAVASPSTRALTPAAATAAAAAATAAHAAALSATNASPMSPRAGAAPSSRRLLEQPSPDAPPDSAERLAVWSARCGGARSAATSRSPNMRALRNDQAAAAAAAVVQESNAQRAASRAVNNAMGDLTAVAGGARATAVAQAAAGALVCASPAGHAAAVAVREVLEGELVDSRQREHTSQIYVERLVQSLGDSENTCAELKVSLDTAQMAKEAATAARDEQTSARAAAERDAAARLVELDAARTELARVEAELATVASSLAKQKQSAAAAQAQGGTLGTQLDTTQHELALATARLAAQEEKVRALHVTEELVTSVTERVLGKELSAADRRIARLETQRDTARHELSLDRSHSAGALPLRAGGGPPFGRAAVAHQPAATPPYVLPHAPGPAPTGLSSARAAELYAAAASDGGQATVALRLVQYETALAAERKRAAHALSACAASEKRATHAEATCRALAEQMRALRSQRGHLAGQLDTSLRELGNAHHAMSARKSTFDPSPSSIGLMLELQQLHVKLHTSPP